MEAQSLQHNGAMKSLICIHKNESGEPHGEIFNRYLKKPIAFTGVMSLINKMDDLCDQTGYPQAYNHYRSFGEKKKPQEIGIMNEAKNDMSDSLLESKTGDKATFIIQVQFRQNSSWQGTITWAERKKTQRYRSTLEMIKLMDSALAEEEEIPVEIIDWSKPSFDNLYINEK